MGVIAMNGIDETKTLRRENRELKKYFGNLAVVIANTLSLIDAAMQGPSTPERGKAVAAACNTLEIANDSLMHFGLKYDFRKISKIKKQWEGFKGARKSKAGG